MFSNNDDDKEKKVDSRNALRASILMPNRDDDWFEEDLKDYLKDNCSQRSSVTSCSSFSDDEIASAPAGAAASSSPLLIAFSNHRASLKPDNDGSSSPDVDWERDGIPTPKSK